MKKIVAILNKVKIGWLCIAVGVMAIVCSMIFPSNTKMVKDTKIEMDSLIRECEKVESVKDSMVFVMESVKGEYEALSTQLDRDASQQIIIDKRTTNINKYIIDTTSKK